MILEIAMLNKVKNNEAAAVWGGWKAAKIQSI